MLLTTIDRKRLKLTQTLDKISIPSSAHCSAMLSFDCKDSETEIQLLQSKTAQNYSRDKNPPIFLAQADLHHRNAAEQLNYQQLQHSRMYSFLIEYTQLQAINKIKRTFRMNKNIPLNKIYSH